MADLDELNSALPTKVAGATALGQETNFMNVDSNGSAYSILKDSSGTSITAASNGTAGNQLLHTQAPDTTTASTALGVLNATVVVNLAGMSSVGFQIAAGTLVGTLTPECSIDGGTTWIACTFFDPVNSAVSTSLVFSIANTLKIFSVLPLGGSSHARVKVSAYTSGTANSVMRASMVTGAAGAITAAAFSTVANTYPSLTANTAVLILAANANRKFASISNNSGSVVSIQFGSATGLNSIARGLVIPDNTYYIVEGTRLFTGAIYAYTNSGSVTLSVTEGTP